MASMENLDSSTTSGRSKLVCGVELPAPRSGYPTLDVLGALTSTVISKGSTPSKIAQALLERALIEAGIQLDEELLLRPLREWAAAETASNARG